MAKQIWKPGNMIYPLPAVMVSVTDGEGNDNIITVAWTGTVCTNPAMAYISVRPSRYSYGMLKKRESLLLTLQQKNWLLRRISAESVPAGMLTNSKN